VTWCADVLAPCSRETDADEEVHAPKVFVKVEGGLKSGIETESGASLDGERGIVGVVAVAVSRIVLEVIFASHTGIESETYADP